jgi:hypothetical protein
MIFYLKYKNKKIVELDVDLTLEHFKITDYKILSSNLSNMFENLNEDNKKLGLMILNNFVNNRIYLPERIITDYIHKKDVIMLNKKVYKYDYETSPHFVNILNKFTSFTDNFSISPCPQYSDRIYHIHNVYNLKTQFITVERYDTIYQEIFEDQEYKKEVIHFFKEFYNEKYSNFLKFDDSSCRRIGFKFNKNVQFISIADLLIDYVKHLSNPFFEINQNIYIKNKIFKFYGEKASQAFDEKPFFDFSQNIDIDFNLCFLLKKKDDFIFFQFF